MTHRRNEAEQLIGSNQKKPTVSQAAEEHRESLGVKALSAVAGTNIGGCSEPSGWLHWVGWQSFHFQMQSMEPWGCLVFT